MAKHILLCPKCMKYTMSEKCSECGSIAATPKPAKYSPDDKYAKFRRQAKEEGYKEKDLL